MLQSVAESRGLTSNPGLCDVHGGCDTISWSCFHSIWFRPVADTPVEQFKMASWPLNTTTFWGLFVRAPCTPNYTHTGNCVLCINVFLMHCIYLFLFNFIAYLPHNFCLAHIYFYSAPVCERSIAISLSVCLRVCLSASISLKPLDPCLRIICANPLWPWLGLPLAALRYAMYFRFYKWRHVWPYWAVWRCIAITGRSPMSMNALFNFSLWST